MKKLLTLLIVSLLIIPAIILAFPTVKAGAATSYNFLFPVNNGGEIYCVYGYSYRYYNYSQFHTGIDIHTTTGDDTIYSAVEGEVTHVANECFHIDSANKHSSDFGKCSHGYGNVVYVTAKREDGTTYQLIYAHLKQNSILVKKGQTIKKGQAIATMGSSGKSSGKHLHFQVNSNGATVNINPDGGLVKYSYSGYGCDCKAENNFSSDGVCNSCNTYFKWQDTFSTESRGMYTVLNSFVPSLNNPYDVDEKASTEITKGSIQVLGTVTNAHGEKWYKISYDDGQIGYVLSSYLQLTALDELVVNCIGFTPAENEKVLFGQGYPVFGNIISNYPLFNIVAKIDGEQYGKWEADSDNITTISVNPIEINTNLKFATLSIGNHTITLIATDIHGRTKVFFTRSFVVENSSCSHSYGYSNNNDKHWKQCNKCYTATGTENHQYDNPCDSSCSVCGYVRTKTHTFDNDCDPSCNDCEETRSASHSYQYKHESVDINSGKHWEECIKCGYSKNEGSHIYHPVFYNGIFMAGVDGHYVVCHTCGDFLVDDHDYDNDCDTMCNICNHKNSARDPSHTYSYICDESCNVCGELRTTTHSYGSDYHSDPDYHWIECTVCAKQENIVSHTPGDVATEKTDQVCTECGYIIEEATGHIHRYGSEYVYNTNMHWFECEGCDEKKDAEKHSFDEGIVTKEPSATEKGEKICTCVCGAKVKHEIPLVSSGSNDSGDDQSGNPVITVLLVGAFVALIAYAVFAVNKKYVTGEDGHIDHDDETTFEEGDD